MRLTTHLPLVRRLRISGAIYISPPVIYLCLHGMNRNNFIFYKIDVEMLYTARSVAVVLFLVLLHDKHWLLCRSLFKEKMHSCIETDTSDSLKDLHQQWA